MRFILHHLFNRFIHPFNESILMNDVIFVKNELYSLRCDLNELYGLRSDLNKLQSDLNKLEFSFECLEMSMIVVIVIASFYKFW